MSTEQRRRPRPIWVGAAVLLLVGGIVAVVLGLQPPASAGPPPGSAGIAAPAASATPTASPSASSGMRDPSPIPTPLPTADAVPVLDRSFPSRIEIPAIGVDSSLMELGLKSDGTIQVPPYDKNAPAGWYRGSPTPGELGPSVILGHVDTFKAGPVVFYRLSQLHEGEHVTVHRKDGTSARFVIDRVENVPKAGFPTLKVYGNTDRPELRLITCGGEWNPKTHDYNDNTVVFAHLLPPKA